MSKGWFRSTLWVATLVAGLYTLWGAWEAAFHFAIRFGPWQVYNPWTLPALLSAGLLNYGALGILSGLAAAAGFTLLALSGRGPETGRFVVAALPGTLFITVTGYHIHAGSGPLGHVPLSHPLSVAATLAIVAAGTLVAWVVYRFVPAPSRTAVGARRRLATLVLAPIGLGIVVGEGRALLLEPPPEPASLQPRILQRRAVDTNLRSGEAPPPNVVLITIETPRADHLNAWGYEAAETSPAIDRIAASGARFARAHAQASWTLPSMASLFTSRYSRQHGMVHLSSVLPDDITTLPKELEKRGYLTATFTTNPSATDPAYGFQEVIESFPLENPYFVSPVFPKPFLIFTIYRYLMLRHVQLNFPRQVGDWYTDAERLNRPVMEWLGETPGPFFLHVHYLDPHNPYFEHPYRRFQIDYPAAWNRDTLLERYDGEIRFLDGYLEKLVAAIDQVSPSENTLLVITADHGEEFLDHDGWGHGHTLFGEVLEVPLLFRWPGRIGAETVVQRPVELVDIAPTVIDLLGGEPPESWEGRSLAPALQGGELAPKPVIAHHNTPVGRMEMILDGDLKLIRGGKDGLRTLLFDLSSDPDEHHDLSAERPAEVQRLASQLDSIDAYLDSRAVDASTRELSQEELDKLRALGYVN